MSFPAVAPFRRGVAITDLGGHSYHYIPYEPPETGVKGKEVFIVVATMIFTLPYLVGNGPENDRSVIGMETCHCSLLRDYCHHLEHCNGPPDFVPRRNICTPLHAAVVLLILAVEMDL